MRCTFRPLFLAAACLLFAAPSQAEGQIYYPPGPIYRPVRPVYPGVYVYPQVVTPTYWASPYYSGYPYNPRVYGDYVYSYGTYGYWASPYGSSYYYTNPGFFYWYRLRW